MSANPVPAIESAEFTAQMTIENAALQIAMTGTADLNVQKELDTFLSAVHVCATDNRAPSVLVDVTELAFINSSCLKCLVRWTFEVRDQPAERQYRIIFIANPAAQWQRRSLRALLCMCAELVSIRD